ncbi:MAG: PAS domain-containing sensor histidine kinase [Psychrosphaera sp.]|nr:PAS domain-containing sensor histidine kinase [Psychrosphaera sp.]
MKTSRYIRLLILMCLIAGTLTVTLFDARFEQQLSATQVKWMVLGLVGLLIIGLLWLERALIKPLEQLTELTGKNPNTDLMKNLMIKKGPVEIQQLTNNFNQMHQCVAYEMAATFKAQVSQRRAKARLKALVDNVSLSIITIDSNGKIKGFNHATLNLFTLSDEQLQGAQITELLPNLNINGGLFKQILNAGVDIELDAIVGNKIKPVELSCAEFNYTINQQHIRQFSLILHDVSHRKRNEERVKKLNQRLINTSRQAGIAEIATSILHSVGNVLNSVNTSVSMLQHALMKSKTEGIQKAAQMLKTQGIELFQPGGKGPQLVEYLQAIFEQLEQDKHKNLDEIASLKHNVNHIAEIVSAQQKFSGKSGLLENLNISELIEEALNINVVSLENNQVEVERCYSSELEINGDRSKIVLILVNLVRNASEAMVTSHDKTAKITLKADIQQHNITISVKDNGHGISQQNMNSMFRYGFTTKQDGHGFGLHSCALAAKEMQGSLSVHSDGPDQGALFKLTLPLDPSAKEAEDIAVTLAPQSKNGSQVTQTKEVKPKETAQQ